MTPEARAEYIVSCIREAGAMYPYDAAKFLADHDAHRRAEALEEAALSVEGGWGPVAARRIRRLAGKDTGGAPAGESTQPAQIWYLFEEDTPYIVTPRLYATKAAAEQGTIDRYQAAGEYSPDYSWRPHEDGAHELLAGGEPVGIYLAPATVSGEAPGAPDFFQPGRTYIDGNGYRAPETLTIFRVEHVATHPGRGTLRAFGWAKIGAAPGGTWHGYFQDESEFRGWTEYAEGEASRD